jgi:hypothetical protein
MPYRMMGYRWEGIKDREVLADSYKRHLSSAIMLELNLYTNTYPSGH